MLYLAGLIVLLGAATVHGRSDGAPTGACADMTPPSRTDDGHGATSQTDSTFPYEVTFSKTCFKAGDSVDVTVKVKSGQNTATNFKGVLLQARKSSNPNTAEYFGTWDVLSSNLKTMDCTPGTKNAVTHKNSNDKTEETVRWTAPAESVLSSDVVFRATVVQVKQTFWVKENSAKLTYSATCGATSFTLSTALVAALALIKSLL